MRYQVQGNAAAAIRLAETETVAAVLQNIAMILATRKGTVPLYRSFGLTQAFLDKPLPVARVMMVAEIREALAAWEPRAEFVGVTFSEDPAQPGRLIPTVEVEIDNA